MSARISAALLVSAMLASCASQSGVQPIGQGRYMASKQAVTGLPGLGNLKAELVTDGAAFCKQQGGEFQLLASREPAGPYILGNYPRAEIEFACSKP